MNESEMDVVEKKIKLEDEKSQVNDDNQASTSNQNDNKFLEYDNFSQFFDNFSNQIKETVASSTKIPMKPNDIEYYLTCPSFKEFFQSQNERILNIIGKLLKLQGIKKSNISSNKLDDEERMDLLIDVNDQIIEKLGIQLDEIQGLRKKTETELKLGDHLNITSRNINTSWNKDMGMVVNKTLLQTLQTSNNTKIVPGNSSQNDLNKKIVVEKPQKYFKDKIDNSTLPFLPKIRQKPNALRPLPEIFSKLTGSVEINQELFEQNLELLENPYSFEIDQLVFDESLLQLDNIVPTLPKTVDETTYKYIDNLDDLIWLCNHLGKDNRSKIKEIAVDLEHHSYRSFLGFTCLMQISTRYDDYIIDTIKLRSEMYRLNEIFSDWTLIKILHGADFDIEWLQKDFGIYVVNMFDTGQAARILQYPHFSLSYLLQKFCNVNAQKQYQLADWRQRPLSEALIRYAREDTHYLLYIYDKLKSELINQQKNGTKLEETPLFIVFDKSKTLCKKTYRKPIFYSKGFMNICQSNSHLNAKQMKALHDLYTWRDKIARESDESCEYVLKSHQLLKIAELLPREIYGILALCNPLSAIVETYVHEMHEIVKEAREYKGTNNLIEIGMNLTNQEKNINALMNKLSPFGLINQKESNKNNAMDSIVQFAKYDPDNILNCPHDFPHKYQESQNSDQMDMQQANDSAIEEVSKLSLNDILIKPNNKISQLDMPKSLNIPRNGSSLKELFVKTNNQEITKIKNIKKLEEKVKDIKSSMRSPFEFFLPKEIRKVSEIDENETKWNLIKSVQTEVHNQVQINPTDLATEQSITNDINMIPLKQQFKKEKHVLLGHDKKKKKALKNVDFSDAIIEYNKSKTEKINALGSIQEEESSELNEQSQKLNELINKKLTENLKSLSEQVKVGSFEFGGASSGSGANESSEGEFVYDTNDMNKLFSKPQSSKDNVKYDPSSRLKQNKFDKINKRRQTNLVSRAKHNLTYTYKEPNK